MRSVSIMVRAPGVRARGGRGRGMRGVARGSGTAGLAAAVLFAGLTACTGGASGHHEAKAPVRACADGSFTWSGIRHTDELTGVSDVEVLGVGGGPLRHGMRRVSSPRPSVRGAGPAVSAAEVLFSLGKRIGAIDSDARTLAEDDDGTTYAFTDVHAKAPAPVGRTSRIDGAGHFVQYAGVRMEEGDFRYSCADGGTTTGHARNWTVDLTGILDCQVNVARDGLARQAARHSCAAGSPAVRDA
ncbi:hypothetical protein AB0N07_29260, partial [Streptomyces sp. NPDC051172]|uniref:hypothetical protein n=1 Tax=Streptomyces sp. NPDC051172 TaxID=3155796 RepID=UPI00342497A0